MELPLPHRINIRDGVSFIRSLALLCDVRGRVVVRVDSRCMISMPAAGFRANISLAHMCLSVEDRDLSTPGATVEAIAKCSLRFS